jgi:hypothetical protein
MQFIHKWHRKKWRFFTEVRGRCCPFCCDEIGDALPAENIMPCKKQRFTLSFPYAACPEPVLAKTIGIFKIKSEKEKYSVFSYRAAQRVPAYPRTKTHPGSGHSPRWPPLWRLPLPQSRPSRAPRGRSQRRNVACCTRCAPPAGQRPVFCRCPRTRGR